MRPIRPGRKNFVALFVVFVALTAAWYSQKSGPTPDAPGSIDQPATTAEKAGERPGTIKVGPLSPAPPVREANAGPRASFDFYLLALSSHPAFCADGHSRKAECRGDSPPISIHGLWPERLQPRTYPHDCAGPPLDLDDETSKRLATLMPGMADGLHEHEWREHGTCSGLDDDEYFGITYTRAQRVAAALGDRLTTLAGQRSSAAALREFAEMKDPGIGPTLTFHCRTIRDAPAEHRREPYLVEIRQCIDDDFPGGLPGGRIACATVNRRDQGCGQGFRIAP